jgi:hypothetical protein
MKKTLTAIYSYSYRADSARRNFALWHCAKPRKSPIIGQLQGFSPLLCDFGETLASIS